MPRPQVKLAEQHLLQARRHHGSLQGDKGRLDERIATLRLETDTTTREVAAAAAGRRPPATCCQLGGSSDQC